MCSKKNKYFENNLHCQIISSDYDITNIIALPGGGIPAIFYSTGILYALHNSNILLKKTDEKYNFNDSFVITASSGGVVPLLLLQCILCNNLQNSRNDWFEHYLIKTVDLIKPIYMIHLYITSLLKSMCVYTGNFNEIVRICNNDIHGLLLNILPPEIINGKSLFFDKDINSHMLYNYIIDSAYNDSPEISNDFSHLNDMNIITQLSEIITTCCIAISFSELKSGILNDSALSVDCDIIQIEKYKNLKSIYYYSLNAYDSKTNNNYREPLLFTISNFNDRSSKINNYKSISKLRDFASKNGNNIHFNMIVLPNKYSPIRKYNNKIYNELVQDIFFQNDFSYILNFSGILNNDPRMIQLILLIGAFETMYIFNTPIETVNKLTDLLPVVYKQILDDPYNVYFKKDPLSILTRLFNTRF
jgi:hypothetical protein